MFDPDTNPLIKLAHQINDGHREIVAAETGALLKAFEVGTWLEQTRELMRGEGRWLKWLADNVEFSQASAYDYRRIAKH
jgi:DUF3102 family protein